MNRGTTHYILCSDRLRVEMSTTEAMRCAKKSPVGVMKHCRIPLLHARRRTSRDQITMRMLGMLMAVLVDDENLILESGALQWILPAWFDVSRQSDLQHTCV